MVDFILSLSTWAGCIVVMGFTVVTGFVVYISSYKLISKQKREDMKDSTTNLFRVVGMLVSLMLALAFSEVIIETRTIRKAIQSEFYISLKTEDMDGIEELKMLKIKNLVRFALNWNVGTVDQWHVMGVGKMGP